MKHTLSAIMLCGIVLLGACTNTNHLEEPTITADKPEYSVLSIGESITFTVNVNSDDFECAKFHIDQYEGGDASIYNNIVVFEEDNLAPSTEYTFTYTATEVGKFSCSMEVWVKCGSDQGNHSIFSGLGFNFEVL